jgi:ectoine hydroxylase-related dioxygenase (phytanoyl-CoA dioxygenase family)
MRRRLGSPTQGDREGSIMSASVSEAQVAAFREDGYLPVAEFFSDSEVSAMQREVARFKSDGLVRNVSAEGDGATRSQKNHNLQLIPLHPHSTLFRALPFADKVVDAVGALIGHPLRLHLSQMFLKPGRTGQGTSWHQDNAYFGLDNPLGGTAMWIAVHDATIANGTMNLIGGMQHETLDHERDPYSDHHIRCYPPEDRAVPIELAAGGVAFFCYGTPHCTRANETDHDRAGVAYHFFCDDYIPERYADRIKDMPLVSGDARDDGAAHYDAVVAGTWDAEVSALADNGSAR